MSNKKHEEDKDRKESAADSWFALGCLLGPLAWLVALATDSGDGRGDKALSGCIAFVVLIVFLAFVAVF